MKGYEAVEFYLNMSDSEFIRHDGEEITLEDGVLHLDYCRQTKHIRFFTFEELNIIKQAWREQKNWHPVESLISVIDLEQPYYIPLGIFEFKKGA